MGKHVFGLQQVLNYRMEMEKVRKLEFASAKQAFEGARDRLVEEESRVHHLGREFLTLQQEGMSAVDLQMYADFFRRKKTDIQLQQQQVVSLETSMEEKQDVLAEAARDKKMLETLKEKKVRLHRREMQEKEQAFLEELALRGRGN
jgi:flagellar FliJ protein